MMKTCSLNGFWILASLLVASKLTVTVAQLCSSSSDCDNGNNCCFGLCWSIKCVFGGEQEQEDESESTGGVFCSTNVECEAHAQLEFLADRDEVHCCSGQCMTQTKCAESEDKKKNDMQVIYCSTNLECEQHANYAVFVAKEDTYCCSGECMPQDQCQNRPIEPTANGTLLVIVGASVIGAVIVLVIIPIVIFFGCKFGKQEETRMESTDPRVNGNPPFVRYSVNPPKYERYESDFSSIGSQSVIQDSS